MTCGKLPQERDDAAATGGRARGAERPWYLSATPLATRPWIVRVHAATALLGGAIVLVALVLPAAGFPLGRLAWLIGLSALAHAGAAAWLSRDRPVPSSIALVSLVVDTATLTGLLELTGGPFNPFSVVYGVYIVLAAITLGPFAAWLMAAVVLGCQCLLFYWHTLEDAAGHHRLNDFPTHLFTMWMTTIAVAELVAYFVGQASNALERRERELEAMRARAARSERLASLATLAAGAAHELSTPLATIALTARELEHAADRAAAGSALAADARLIRAEVDRCRAILDQMSGRAGGIAADTRESVDVVDAVRDAIGHLAPQRASRVRVEAPRARPSLRTSRDGLRQALLSLIGNAIDASPDGEPVTVVVEETSGAGMVRIAVQDRGPGMTPAVLARAGEPFFTTKEPGRGLGLGLFLARLFAERYGGALGVRTGEGTRVVLELPMDVEEGGAA